MEPPENTNEVKKDSISATPTDEAKDTTKTPCSCKWSAPANIISVILLCITFALAFVNYITYSKTADYNIQTIENYKIRNRPFVKIKPIDIINKGKEYNLNSDKKVKDTIFHFRLQVKNFGQFPAFIDETYVWIENVLDNSKDLIIWGANEDYAIKRFALFQNEDEVVKRQFLLGNSDIEKIKNKDIVYFVFLIKYNTLGVKKGLQSGPFFYWAKYRCPDFVPDIEWKEYKFLIEECGDTDIGPNSHNNEHNQKSVPPPVKPGTAGSTHTVATE